MGSMSMSDAAPLPRLGEVFFDVRSPSRSLRISWYADTGVAVLSIWQGGTCTGSFRLPMSDLPRMIEALQRGPDGQALPAGKYPPHPAGAQPPYAREAQYSREAGHAADAAGYDGYPAGPGSLHYLNGAAPERYPDETGAGQPPGSAPARYPDETGAGQPPGSAPARYPDETGTSYPPGSAPANYPDGTGASYPPDGASAHYPGQTGAGYPDGPAPPGYRDAPLPPYQDESGPANYPTGLTHRDSPAEPPGGQYTGRSYPADPYPADPYPAGQYPAGQYPDDQYPAGHYLNGAEPQEHSPQLADPDYTQPPPGSPYGHGRPGRAAELPAHGRDPRTAVPAGDGLEPLPESFPYGEPRQSHRL